MDVEEDEQQNLLASQEQEEAHRDIDQPDQPISTKPPFQAARWQAQTPRTIILLIALIKFGMVCSGMVLVIPIFRLIEDTLCHVYYQDDSNDLIKEMKCKVDKVQSKFAFLIGWLALVQAVVTMIVAFPYGMLADKIGRKPAALLSYLGVALSYMMTPFLLGTLNKVVRRNPYVLMTASLFTLIGGGVQVFLATLYAIAADVSSEEEK